MPILAPKSNLNSIFIPYFDWEGGLAQPVVTSFWPQIGPLLQTRMCAEQEKNAVHWFQALEMCIMHMKTVPGTQNRVFLSVTVRCRRFEDPLCQRQGREQEVQEIGPALRSTAWLACV